MANSVAPVCRLDLCDATVVGLVVFSILAQPVMTPTHCAMCTHAITALFYRSSRSNKGNWTTAMQMAVGKVRLFLGHEEDNRRVLVVSVALQHAANCTDTVAR